MAKDSYPLIAYRNDALRKGAIEELVVFDASKYAYFFEVVDHPVEKGKSLNKRLIWTPFNKKSNVKNLTRSGDYSVIGKVSINNKLLK